MSGQNPTNQPPEAGQEAGDAGTDRADGEPSEGTFDEFTEVIEAEIIDVPDGEIIEVPDVAEEGAAGRPEDGAAFPGLDLPDDPEQAVTVLSAALMEARTQANTNLDDYRRMAADFDNFRKRSQRDQADLVTRASERVLVNLLPVLDSFDMALGLPAETEGEEKMLVGMRSTHDQLLSILATEGLTPIPTVGEEFDPNVHEAIQMADGSGTMYVTAEVRRGYRLGERVLRAALVIVGYDEG